MRAGAIGHQDSRQGTRGPGLPGTRYGAVVCVASHPKNKKARQKAGLFIEPKSRQLTPTDAVTITLASTVTRVWAMTSAWAETA